MTDSPQPDHLFRVQIGCGDTEYIAADYMDVGPENGIVTFYTGLRGQPIAAFFPHPGLSVVRVDALTTTFNLEGDSTS